MRSLTLLENLRLGFKFLSNYKSMERFLNLTSHEIADYQFYKIQELVRIAYLHTPFYRNKYSKLGIQPENIKTWRDFRKLPTVTKEELIDHLEDCIVDTRKNDKSLIISRSSGSSGKMLSLILDGEFFINEALITLRMFKSVFDYTPLDKQALIYTSKYPYCSILGMYKAYYINTLTPAKEILEKLKSLKAELIVIYPSLLMELVQNFRNECEKYIKPKAISTNSEQTTQAQRDFIASIFKCPVFDEYSSEELSRVAFQCVNKKYHLQEDCSYIEIMDTECDDNCKNGEIGEIVGTCLINQVMPIIRYRQGDLGSIKKSTCFCGNNGRILENISGRKNSSFKLQNGQIIPSGRILDWTYSLFLNLKLDILQFQVIQEAPRVVRIVIVPGTNYNNEIHDKQITDSFKEMFEDFETVEVEKVPTIPKTQAGKHLPIMSRVV